MKYLKRFFIFLIILVIGFGIFVLGVLGIDYQSTSYLYISKEPSLAKSSYLIRNVNIIPMTSDTVLNDYSVWVEAGTIKQIGKSLDVKDIEEIDGEGLFLSPGLVDMHVHVWDRYELRLYLANGVTTIRNLWGIPMHLRFKKAINNQEIIAPLFYSTSPKLTGKDDLGDDKIQLNGIEQAKSLVKSYQKRGYDFIKTYAGLPEDIYKAILQESESLKIPVVSHPSFSVDYAKHMQPQVATIEHTEDIVQQALDYHLDTTKLAEVVTLFVQNQQSFCPTLTGYYNIVKMLNAKDLATLQSDMALINPLMQEFDSKVQFDRWQNEKKINAAVITNIETQHQFHLYIINQLHQSKVNIVCGTDAGIGITVPGESIHEELAFYQKAGLSNYEVLRTATANPGLAHKEFADFGTIEEGKIANFILSAENPLENLSTLKDPMWVMVKGRQIDRNLLQKFTEKAEDRGNFLATGLRWAEYMYMEKF